MRRVMQVGSIVWAVVGLSVALAGLRTVDSDARLLVGIASVLGPLAALLACGALDRHRDRAAGALLLVSALTPTYFAAVLNLPALLAGAALLVAPSLLFPRASSMRH